MFCSKCGASNSNDSKFCSGCGIEISGNTTSAGANSQDNSKKGEAVYTSYAQVPVFRKNWFAILSFLTVPILLLPTLITGNVYYEKKGELKTYTKAARIFLICWSLLFFALALNTVFGNSDSKEVRLVKGGTLKMCPNHTVEEMVSSFMGKPTWASIKADDGKKYVNIGGQISYSGKPVKASIQFAVNGDNFNFQAFEMNDVPSANLIAVALLGKMCESAGGASEKVSSDNSANQTNQTPPQQKAEDKYVELTATDVSFARGEFGALSLTGKVANITGKKLAFVQVEINLFDESGAQVGSTLANVNNLESGITWNFEAPILESHVHTAKVANILYY